jgi:hypothetical protein
MLSVSVGLVKNDRFIEKIHEKIHYGPKSHKTGWNFFKYKFSQPSR